MSAFTPDAFGLALLLLLCAPAVGSFVTVLIDRLPRGEDVLRVPSACRACGQRLGLRDLVPVASFVACHGCCRHCKAAIPPWQLQIEIAATGAAVLALVAGSTPADILLGALVLWLLLALAGCDLLWFRLPDVLTAALFGLALASTALAPGPGGTFVLALLGAALGSGSFWALRIGYRRWRGRDGLGLGDVKLMAGIGALVGPQDLALTVLLAALLALAAAALGAGRRTLRATRALPFGAALCAATAIVWLLEQTAI